MPRRLFAFLALILLVLPLLLTGCQASTPIPVQPGEYLPLLTPSAEGVGPQPGLHIITDPRIELLAVIQSLSGYDQRLKLLTRENFTYKSEIKKTFSPYRDHAAVHLFDQISSEGFSFDAPPAVMLYLSDPPELEVQTPIPDGLVARAGGPDRLGQWIDALRSFSRDTLFMDFYEDQAVFYHALTANTSSLFSGADELALLEDYYGMRQHSYTIILAPLFHSGGFGPSLERSDGSRDIFSIIGPKSIVGLPVFGSSEDFRYLIWHEFAHAYVNPLTDEHLTQVSKYQHLYPPIQNDMQKMAYPNWEVSVNEHIVRAVTIRLAAQALGAEEGARRLETERSQGFRYIDLLVSGLEQYETQRGTYPSFAEFYPELIQAFDEAE